MADEGQEISAVDRALASDDLDQQDRDDLALARDLQVAMRAAKANGQTLKDGLSNTATERLADPTLPDEARQVWEDLQLAGNPTQNQATSTGTSSNEPSQNNGWTVSEGRNATIDQQSSPTPSEVPAQTQLPPTQTGMVSAGSPTETLIPRRQTPIATPADSYQRRSAFLNATDATDKQIGAAKAKIEAALMARANRNMESIRIPESIPLSTRIYRFDTMTGVPLRADQRIQLAIDMGLSVPETQNGRRLTPEEQIQLLDEALERRDTPAEKKIEKIAIPTHDASGISMTPEQRVAAAERLGVTFMKVDPHTGKPLDASTQIALYEGRLSFGGGGI